MFQSFPPLIIEIFTYIFVVCGFAGITTLFLSRKLQINVLTDILFSGFTLYVAFFAIVRWFQLSPLLLIFLLITILVVGYFLLLRYLFKNQRSIKPLVIFLAVLVLIYVGFSLIPSIVGGVDANHYAIEMAWSMNLGWLKTYSNILGQGSESLFLDANNYYRAATPALGWLNNLSHISIHIATVQRHITLYFILTLLQLWKIQSAASQKSFSIKIWTIIPFGIILAGAHYLQSITSLGQLNAAMGIFLLVSITLEVIILNKRDWQWWESWRLCLLTFILFVTYTEIIFMLPLFMIIGFLISEKITLHTFLKTLVPPLLGIVPVFSFHIKGFIDYIAGQSSITLGIAPLGSAFQYNLLTIASELTSSVSDPIFGLISLAILSILLIGSTICLVRKKYGKDHFRSAVVGKLLLIWSFVSYYLALVIASFARTGSPNYALFKLASWSAPLLALILLTGWLNIKSSDLSKYLQAIVFTCIGGIALFSGFGSALFLGRFLYAPASTLPHFVSNSSTIELSREHSLEERLLYDLTWVEYLAPWNNIPIVRKTQ